MILIEHEGRRQVVASLDGHDACTVLAEDIPAPPGYCTADDLLDDGTVPVELTQNWLWERAKAIRSEKETGVAPTPIGGVQIDEKSKAKIMGALDFCRLREEQGQPFAMNFTMADNSRVVLDNTTVRQLAGAAGLYVAQLYDYSWTLRDAIFADGVSAEDLAAIDVEAGWP
jgi:hypothetical protein